MADVLIIIIDMHRLSFGVPRVKVNILRRKGYTGFGSRARTSTGKVVDAPSTKRYGSSPFRPGLGVFKHKLKSGFCKDLMLETARQNVLAHLLYAPSTCSRPARALQEAAHGRRSLVDRLRSEVGSNKWNILQARCSNMEILVDIPTIAVCLPSPLLEFK